MPTTTTKFVGPPRIILYTCVATRRSARSQRNMLYICGRRADSQGHNATFGTRVWATRRLIRSQSNKWCPCVGDTAIHWVGCGMDGSGHFGLELLPMVSLTRTATETPTTLTNCCGEPTCRPNTCETRGSVTLWTGASPTQMYQLLRCDLADRRDATHMYKML